MTDERVLRWHTASEPWRQPPDPWYIWPIAARGALTILAGEQKLAGKSFFMLSLMRAMLDGEEFGDRRMKKGPVILCTEQPPASFRDTLTQTGMIGQADCHFIHRYQLAGSTWDRMLTEVKKKAREVHPRYIIIDTFSNWAGFKSDEENSSSSTRTHLVKLQSVAVEYNAAALVLHHVRKHREDATLIQAVRGYGGITDPADIVVGLHNPRNNPKYVQRRLEAIGRFADLPEEPLIIRFREGRYTLVTKRTGTQTSGFRRVQASTEREAPQGERGVPRAGQGWMRDRRRR